MAREIETFITQMKLQELRKQRDALLQSYDDLSQRAAQTPEGIERLRTLYDGLRKIQFAGRPLHPDISNLHILNNEIAQHPPAAELLAFWTQQLEREVTLGRNRAEAVYVFGVLLEEWALQPATTADSSARDDIHTRLIDFVTQTSSTGDYETLLAPLLKPYQAGLKKKESRSYTQQIRGRVTTDELNAHLKRIRGDIYRPAELRAQARTFLSDEAWQKELADALTLMIENLDSWTWPTEGIVGEAVWTRTKWRLLLKEDLPTACLLEVLGSRWARVFKQMLLDRTPALQLPELVSSSETAEETSPKKETGPDYYSVGWQRNVKLQELRENIMSDVYGGGYGASTLDKALIMINAEIRTWQAALPGQPLYVVKADLRDYYPSLSHNMLRYLLEQFKLSQADIAFFLKFMSIPLQQGGSVVTAQRGLVSHRILSDVLGELVLRLLDDYIHTTAKTVVIRVVDDICLISATPDDAVRSWHAIEEFCAACGLSINTKKSGSVAIGGARPAGLPDAKPAWQLLVLDENGDWSVDDAKLEEHIETARKRIPAITPIIAQVETFNANLNYLIRAVAVSAPLGDQHRQSLAQAIAKFQYSLFGQDQGIVARLQTQLRERFLQGARAGTIPEALFYYPITAGGLGLQQGLLVEACFATNYRKRTPTAVPEKRPADWQRRSREWGTFYIQQMAEVRSAAPEQTTVMETLVKDFIERGSSLTSGKQQDLSYYWRWILYIYGAQILETFGTFRFLIEELVPMQLIVQQRMDDTSLFEDSDM